MTHPMKLCAHRHIAVGSQNPVKITATRILFTHLCGTEPDIEALAVNNGLPPQPWGDVETRRGAIRRAQEALRLTEADWGVGFEGGLLEIEGDLYTSAWCAVVSADGRIGTAGGENLLLPPAVVAAVRGGLELGEAIDRLLGTTGSKWRGGAIGALTGGRLIRTEAYEQLLLMALAPFLTSDYYEVER